MNTFSSGLKLELIKQPCENESCCLSELAGIIMSCGEISLWKNNEKITLQTELIDLYDKINELLSRLYNGNSEIEISDENSFTRTERYEITINAPIARKVLEDTEIVYVNEEGYTTIQNGISQYLINDSDMALSYIKGIILGCFTTNIILNASVSKELKSSGYHVEFVFSNEKIANDFSSLLAQFEIMSKKVVRKNLFVVYIKDFEQICTLIGLVKANKSYLKLQNENTFRSVRNQVNRQNNCETGNITKVVNASLKQLEDIKVIQECIGLESLDHALQEVCYLRLANPEESLENLVLLNGNRISKSGLYHRFKKLEKIAKELG